MFELHHFLGQVPESFVERHVAIDALNGTAGGHQGAGRLPFRVVPLSAFGGVFLHHVERAPCVVSAVLVAAWLKQFHRADRCRIEIAEADDGRGLGVSLALAVGQGEILHPVEPVHQGGDALGNLNAGFDHFGRFKAKVRDADPLERLVAHDKAIEAKETENPGVELVGAGTVVAVDDHDFRAFAAGLLDVVAVGETKHVLLESLA